MSTQREWSSSIDRTTQEFLSLLRPLDRDELNWKPGPKQWSIAQNLDHLIEFNSSFFPIWTSLKAGTWKPPFTARIPGMADRIGSSLMTYALPDRKKKTRTMSIWQPEQSDLPGDILERFETHQKELKSRLEETEPLLGKGLIISSPANRFLVYKLDTCFKLLLAHEERHLQQCREVLEAMQRHMNAHAAHD